MNHYGTDSVESRFLGTDPDTLARDTDDDLTTEEQLENAINALHDIKWHADKIIKIGGDDALVNICRQFKRFCRTGGVS